MEEIPVEYNIIIEALNCVVQNQQQALEQGGGQAAFECVVNTSEDVAHPSEPSEEAPQQTVFQCVVDSSEGQPVSYEVTGEATEQEGNVDQTTFACVEAAQSSEQQTQVNFEVVQFQQAQPKQPKEKKNYKCQVCGKIFLHTGSLNRHARTHVEGTKFNCPDCPKTFTQLGNLMRHKRSHTGDTPFKCSICEKTFRRMDIMKLHEKTHLDVKPHRCDVCDNCCLDPNDPEQQKEHREECMNWLEENMKYSFAVQKSDEVCCGICLDKIRLNPDSKDRRFGILPECNHPFCLTCIRKWRSSSKTKDKIVRACPLCRVPSGFVVPSEVWVDDPDEKEKLITAYKDALSKKLCKYFDMGKGTCPFGVSCFYKHANPDGTIAKANVRRYDINSEGETRILNALSLWEFIEARDSLEELLDTIFS